MAGEAAKTESETPSGKSGGIKALLGKLPVLVGGVMVVEAVILIAGCKMFGGGPGTAEGVEPGHGDQALVDGHETFDAPPEMVEVAVDSFRAPNRLNGRTYLYDVEISVRVKSDVSDQVRRKLESSTALVRDRMNRIVAGMDPEKLNGAAEPGLETLRRQVKYQLDLIVGEGLIEEVLIPRCIPYRTDY